LLFPLGLLELELAIVHELAHRGNGVGRDFDQIQAGLVGVALGLGSGHHTQLVAVGANQADLTVTDLLIDLMGWVSYGKAPPEKQKMWAQQQHPHPQQKRQSRRLRVFTMLTSLPWAGGEDGGAIPTFFCPSIISSDT